MSLPARTRLAAVEGGSGGGHANVLALARRQSQAQKHREKTRDNKKKKKEKNVCWVRSGGRRPPELWTVRAVSAGDELVA